MLLSMLLLLGCEDTKQQQATLRFAIAAEYPPFEYIDKGEIKGFDIDVARLIGKKLGVEVVFKNMSFSTIFPMLEHGQVDAAISTLSASQKRRAAFDFSEVYYQSDLAAIFKNDAPLRTVESLAGKRVACQLGSTMELWLRTHAKGASPLAMDHNNQSIEALKAGHVDAVLMDEVQAIVFVQENPGLSYAVIAPADEGYAIAFKKGSTHKVAVDAALIQLQSEGALQALEQKWLSDPSLWKH